MTFLRKQAKLYSLKIWQTKSDKTFYQSLTRGQKVQSRREREIKISVLQFREKKEKPEIPFASFEREKRILKEYAQLSRGESEMDFPCSIFKKRKRM